VQKKHEATEVTTASGKMSSKEFERELAKLQVELVRLQTWVQAKRARAIVIFEGRDTAGKGRRDQPYHRAHEPARLPACGVANPSDREKTQVYIQRYIAHFPAAGEIILFDRSWYNRAGVEHVMGFCTDEEYERFLAAFLGGGPLSQLHHAHAQ
jgi:polyphosphate kinase